MRTGDLRHRVQLLRPETTTSGSGARTSRWVVDSEVWCDLQVVHFKESEEGGRTVTAGDYVLWFRFNPDVDSDMRVRATLYGMTVTLDLIDVSHDGRGGYTKATAREATDG